MIIETSAPRVMYTLYWDSRGNKGSAVTRLASVAPAPIRTNKAGRAQHMRVEDAKNKVRKLTALLFISYLIELDYMHTRSILAID